MKDEGNSSKPYMQVYFCHPISHATAGPQQRGANRVTAPGAKSVTRPKTEKLLSVFKKMCSKKNIILSNNKLFNYFLFIYVISPVLVNVVD